MNSTLKTIIYVVFTFMVLSLVARLFFSLLPFILLIGIVLYGYFKIKGYFIQKNGSSSRKARTYSASSKQAEDKSYKAREEDDFSEVIDVDYKEVE